MESGVPPHLSKGTEQKGNWLRHYVAVSAVILPAAAFFFRNWWEFVHEPGVSAHEILLIWGTLFASVSLCVTVVALLLLTVRAPRMARIIASVVVIAVNAETILQSLLYVGSGFRAAFFSPFSWPALIPNGLLFIAISSTIEFLPVSSVTSSFLEITIFLAVWHSLILCLFRFIRGGLTDYPVLLRVLEVSLFLQSPIYFMMYFLGHSALYAT